MKVLNGLEARASQDSQAGNATDSGFPAIDAATIAKYAGQAAVKLGAMGASSGESTSGKALGAAGEGLRDAGMGAGIGASIGSVIPGVGTVIGGAIGAIGGAIVGVIHYLFGAGHRELTTKERDALQNGLHIYKTRHLPGAFQDAVLYVYSPVAYQALRSVGRLPSETEAQLLKERTYAAHARELERLHGARLRQELAHLPPDFRTLVGVGSITGHSRHLYVALRCALAQPTRRQLHLSLPSRIVASSAPSEILAPPEPTAPYNLAPDGQPEEIASTSPAAPLAAAPVVGATDNEAGAVAGSPVVMRSAIEVFDAGDAVFAWRPIAVSFKRHPHDTSAQTLLGTFWVFIDAMKDRLTGRRCPCSAAETQMVADTLRVAPEHLPQWWGPLGGGEELPCLLMTTRLMCARWLNAKQVGEIIPPHPFSTSDLLVTGCTLTDRAIDTDLARLTRPNPWVADPGKIWALHRRLFDGTAEAVNYGWHFDPVLTPIAMPGSTNAAIPGMSLLQSAGGTHSADHLDYSQKLLLVAPWCMVAAPGQDRMVPMRTADVYQSPEFAGLVTDDALPLRSVRQPFDPNRMHAAREAFWADQERIHEDKRRRGLELLDVLPRADKASGPTRLDRPARGSHAQPTSSGVEEGTYAASRHDPFASLQTNRRL